MSRSWWSGPGIRTRGLLRPSDSAPAERSPRATIRALSQPIDISPAGAAPSYRLLAPARPTVQVVPVRGLPVVAVVLGLLITAIVGNWLWALDFFHVVGGALWTAIDLFVGLVVGPILARLSPAARAEFAARFMPKMVLIMPTLVTCTLGAGFQLARKLDYLSSAFQYHSWLVASFAVVGVMTIIALGILEPANVAVLFEMRKPHPDGAVIGRLMRRFVYTAGVTGVMQVATLVIMTRLAT